MENNSFDKYKEEVGYDFILSGKSKFTLEGGTEEQQIDSLSEFEKEIESLLNNEDFLKQVFTKVGLGRVYPRLNNFGDEIDITFGISNKELEEEFTIEDLKEYVDSFMSDLGDNLDPVSVTGVSYNDGETKDVEPAIIYLKTEGEIEVSVQELEECVKTDSLDSIDKQLVTEGKLMFLNENNIHSIVLSDDGIMEQYVNDKLINSSPFSKLTLTRECKALIQEGYSLTEENNKENTDVDLDNAEQNIKQGIEKVDQIQELKDELEDKVDKLMNEDKSLEEKNYVLAVHTKINDELVYDVLISRVSDKSFYVADGIDDALKVTKQEAEDYCRLYNSMISENSSTALIPLTIEQAIEEEVKNNKVEEDTTSEEFPSSEFTQKVLSKQDLDNIEFEKELTIEQIGWITYHFGDLDTFIENLSLMFELTNFTGDLISIDEYIKGLKEEGGI